MKRLVAAKKYMNEQKQKKIRTRAVTMTLKQNIIKALTLLGLL